MLSTKKLILLSPRRTPANPQNKKWDFVLMKNREAAAATNMELAMLTTIDVMLLAQCDLFVGKFSSNYFRAAYELKSAGCDCAAPFESLDHAWCFDWLEQQRFGNVTHKC